MSFERISRPVSRKFHDLVQTVRPSRSERKPGRPPLEWTAHQQRLLVRCKIDHNVEWKDIPTVMKEDGFSPSLANCQRQWKLLTNMNAKDLQVKDPVKRQRRKEMAIRAFKNFQREQERSLNTLELPPVLPQSDLDAGISPFKPFCTALGTHEPQNPPSTPYASTAPALSIAGTTPQETINETRTPENGILDGLEWHTCDSDLADTVTPTYLENLVSGMMHAGRKRPLPDDFGAPSSSRRLSISRCSTSGDQEESQVRVNGDDHPKLITDSLANHGANSRMLTVSQKVSRSLHQTIADVEARMSLPTGFIEHVRKRWTISRSSQSSAMSSSGSVRSRWSPRSSRQISVSSPQPQIQATRGRTMMNNMFLPQPEIQESYSHSVEDASLPSITDLFIRWLYQKGDIAHFIQELKVLIERGVDINAMDDKDENNTVLHVAIRAEHLQICQILLENGANVNAQNQHGENPLHMAVFLGNLEACKLLLAKGADVYAVTKQGNSVSRHGKIAEMKAGNDTSLYLKIKSCRNIIGDHSPRQKSFKDSKINRYSSAHHSSSKASSYSQQANGSDQHKITNQYRDNVLDLSSNNTQATLDATPSIVTGENPHSSASRNVENGTWTNETFLHSDNLVSAHPNGSGRQVIESRNFGDVNPNPNPDLPPALAISEQLLYYKGPSRPLPSLPPSISSRKSEFAQNKILSSTDMINQTHEQAANTYLPLTEPPSASERRGLWSGQPSFQNLDMPYSDAFAPYSSVDTPPLTSNGPSPTQLSGYIKQQSSGEWALVFPLTNEQLKSQMFNSSPITVQIVSPPMVPLTTAVSSSGTNIAQKNTQILENDAQFLPSQSLPETATVRNHDYENSPSWRILNSDYSLSTTHHGGSMRMRSPYGGVEGQF